jgi:hypothetical protein
VVPEDKFCSNWGGIGPFGAGAGGCGTDAAAPVKPGLWSWPPAQRSAAGEAELIGREDPVSGIYPEVDLTPHGGDEGGVSRRHARLIVEAGQYYVEDLDSTNFTFVNKQKLAPRTRTLVKDADEIRCGRVALTLHTG